MRTTLDIDDDVLFAAKEIAAKERKTAGKILSEYFRRGIQRVDPMPGNIPLNAVPTAGALHLFVI